MFSSRAKGLKAVLPRGMYWKVILGYESSSAIPFDPFVRSEMFICNMIITPCLTFTSFALCRCAGVISADLKKADKYLSLLKLFAQKEGHPNLASLA